MRPLWNPRTEVESNLKERGTRVYVGNAEKAA